MFLATTDLTIRINNTELYNLPYIIISRAGLYIPVLKISSCLVICDNQNVDRVAHFWKNQEAGCPWNIIYTMDINQPNWENKLIINDHMHKTYVTVCEVNYNWFASAKQF